MVSGHRGERRLGQVMNQTAGQRNYQKNHSRVEPGQESLSGYLFKSRKGIGRKE